LLAWTKNDDDFLAAVSAMQGWSSSTDKGVRHPIRRLTVAAFMDADKAKARLQKIASSEAVADNLNSKANSLLNEWDDDTRRGH
jgi:hypothetical protein